MYEITVSGREFQTVGAATLNAEWVGSGVWSSSPHPPPPLATGLELLINNN